MQFIEAVEPYIFSPMGTFGRATASLVCVI